MRYKSFNDYELVILEMVSNKGGKILSNITSSKSKIEILCKNDHIFSITPNKIQQDRWCPICIRASFEDVVEFVKSRGGQVSGQFLGMKHKLIFTCDKKHSWITTVASVMLSGTWCPFCANLGKLDISVFNDIAASYGGKCLSTQYNNQQDKLIFSCKNNHVWEAAAKHIRAGHWCPRCNINKGEEICRHVFESIFSKPFHKCKPVWLINSYGYRLELDGFSEALNIAFEHQGKQHYGIDIFNAGTEAMMRIKENDSVKKELCVSQGIKLIEIPQIFELTKPQDLPSFLQKCFEEQNITNYDQVKLLSMNISRKPS